MEFIKLLANAERIVFFTGAGASTEAPTSIPDFRSTNGLWQDEDLMATLTRSNFFRNPEAFYSTFRQLFLPWKNAEPNAVHQAPPRLANLGKGVGVVTQNIDGLDRRLAKGYPVYELHGHLRTLSCPSCGRVFPTHELEDHTLPWCYCGAVYKPDVVLFEDPLDLQRVFLPACHMVAETDLLVVVGTSLTVTPANRIVTERQEDCPMVILNRDSTPYDDEATLVLRKPAGEILSRALDVLEGKEGALFEYKRYLAE